jgi:hypothetical protein
MTVQEAIQQRVVRGIVRRLNNHRIRSAARQIARHAPEPSGRPVAFFKASTGIDDLSWNSGFHLLASWALRLEGVPVVYFACHAGEPVVLDEPAASSRHHRCACTSPVRCMRMFRMGQLAPVPRRCIGSRSTETSKLRRPWLG